MIDDHEPLPDPAALQLLRHYQHGDEWQDRVARMPGVSTKELTRLHGELLAHDWLEQNTGAVCLDRVGVVALCYRVTAAGRELLAVAACQNVAPGDRAA